MRELKIKFIYQSPDTDIPDKIYVTQPINLALMTHQMESKYTKMIEFTGFTDKNGQEIYENDVLVGPSGEFIVEWISVDNRAFPCTGWNLNKSIAKTHEIKRQNDTK